MNGYIIAAYPRSGTAWLANLLTFEGHTCLHDALDKLSIKDIIETQHGVAETAIWAFWKDSRFADMDKTIIKIDRPLDDINDSCRRLGSNVVFDQGWLDQIKANFVIPFSHLFHNKNTFEILKEHCNPKLTWDRYQWLSDINVQVTPRIVARYV